MSRYDTKCQSWAKGCAAMGFPLCVRCQLAAAEAENERLRGPAVDLEYSLALDQGGTAYAGVYVDLQPTGARIVVDDDAGSSGLYLLTAAECTRLAHYLLACAKAAGA